ncbi:hypothetical protein F4803DRAFT_497434 [Xylaria telfairii]|nr:hypothetical protein F4803DRAFT_497434 [Xylaria telfairii]
MGSQVIQGQWSLNESSTSIYGMARGILQAATSDNVQPLAILACEQFGNTLAISRETRRKIEHTVLPTPEPVSIRFLKAKVGFLKHDCAVQLGSNQAGLRFLALAAALISSLRPIDCAEALMPMLEATTTNERYLPTTRHLMDLMSSLEGRCRLAGFADVVFGYHSIIKGVARAQGLPVCEDHLRVPDPTGIATLIDVFRQMQRIGEDEIESIAVEACASAAWIAAFSKWSLETPPSIYLADGTPVTPQPGSRVVLTVFGDENLGPDDKTRVSRCDAVKVIKRFKIKSLQDLVTKSTCFDNAPTYRIKFETFSAQIQEMLGRNEWERKAIIAAVPLAIRLVLEHIQSIEKPKPSSKKHKNLNCPGDCPSIQPLTTMKPSPFPEIEKIYRTMSLVLGLPPDFPSEILASAKSFRDLPEVESYFDYTSKSNNLILPSIGGTIRYPEFDRRKLPRWWNKGNGAQSGYRGWLLQASKLGSFLGSDQINFLGRMRHTNSGNTPPTSARMNEFINALGFACHIILLLSLLDNLIDVLFAPPQHYVDNTGYLGKPRFFRGTLDILTGKYTKNINASTVFNNVCAVLLLQGIGVVSSNIVQSGGSDCFWFSALDAPLLSVRGYLSITSCRGRIIYRRELYAYVDSSLHRPYFNEPRIEQYTLQSVSHQPFSNFRARWQIAVSQAKLHAGLSVIDEEENDIYHAYSSLDALNMLAYTLVVNCEHQLESSLDQSEVKQKLRSVKGEFMKTISNLRQNSSDIIGIYPMGGNKGLQMYCLGCIGGLEVRFPPTTVILRQEACFDCCIKACEEYKCDYLIL